MRGHSRKRRPDKDQGSATEAAPALQSEVDALTRQPETVAGWLDRRQLDRALSVVAWLGATLMLAGLAGRDELLTPGLLVSAVGLVLAVPFMRRQRLVRPDGRTVVRSLILVAWFAAIGLCAWVLSAPWFWIVAAVCLVPLALTIAELERRGRGRADSSTSN